MKKFDKNNMTDEQLQQLRNEIVVGSLFLSDYKNSFGLDPHDVCNFFDGYLEYLEELMNDDNEGYKDFDFNELFTKYDTIDNLSDWYYCIEEPFGK